LKNQDKIFCLLKYFEKEYSLFSSCDINNLFGLTENKLTSANTNLKKYSISTANTSINSFSESEETCFLNLNSSKETDFTNYFLESNKEELPSKLIQIVSPTSEESKIQPITEDKINNNKENT